MTIKFHEKACDIDSDVGTLPASPSVTGTYSLASLSMAGMLTAASFFGESPNEWLGRGEPCQGHLLPQCGPNVSGCGFSLFVGSIEASHHLIPCSYLAFFSYFFPPSPPANISLKNQLNKNFYLRLCLKETSPKTYTFKIKNNLRII